MINRHRIRAKYWAHSKIPTYIRKRYGIARPRAATMEEWHDIHERHKKEHPVIDWLTDDLISKIQNAVMFIPDVLYSLKCYYNNRFVTRTHMIPTNLSVGEWHEYSDRLMNGMFGLVVDYVEVDLAMENRWLSKDFEKFKIVNGRCPEAGISYLKHKSTMVHDGSPDDKFIHNPLYNTPTPEAISAEKILKLYTFWTNDRPSRSDIYELKDESVHMSRSSMFGINNGFLLSMSERLKLEDERLNEDRDMMKLIIDVVDDMWT